MSNINRVTLTGNLTSDPELRSLPSGMSVCNLRVANNQRAKVDGEWVEQAHYFDVTVWGAQGENAAKFLKRGSKIAVDGRLTWREYTDKDQNKRQAVGITADAVEFPPKSQDSAPASDDTPDW